MMVAVLPLPYWMMRGPLLSVLFDASAVQHAMLLDAGAVALAGLHDARLVLLAQLLHESLVVQPALQQAGAVGQAVLQYRYLILLACQDGEGTDGARVGGCVGGWFGPGRAGEFGRRQVARAGAGGRQQRAQHQQAAARVHGALPVPVAAMRPSAPPFRAAVDGPADTAVSTRRGGACSR
jgi:hypothetical protein